MTIKEYVNQQLKYAGYKISYEDIMKSEYIDDLHWTEYYCWKSEKDYDKFHKDFKGQHQLNWELTHGLGWGWLDFIKQRNENAKKKSIKKSVGKTKS